MPAKVAPMVGEKCAGAATLLLALKAMGYTRYLPRVRRCFSGCAADVSGCASDQAAEKTGAQAGRIPSNFRSHDFHAEAHISAESPQPFEDTRLPQPYEDEERRRSAVAQAREGPQACFRQRGLSRLSRTVCIPFRSGGWILIITRPPLPKVRKNGEMPEARFDWRERPSAKTRGLPARVSGEPKVFVGIDELLFSGTIERGRNQRGAPRGTDGGPCAGRRSGTESHPAAYERGGAAASGRTAAARGCGAASSKDGTGNGIRAVWSARSRGCLRAWRMARRVSDERERSAAAEGRERRGAAGVL